MREYNLSSIGNVGFTQYYTGTFLSSSKDVGNNILYNGCYNILVPLKDFNGDGISDFIQGINSRGFTFVYRLILGKERALGLKSVNDEDSQYFYSPRSQSQNYVTDIGDFNGDGLSDLSFTHINIGLSTFTAIVYGTRVHFSSMNLKDLSSEQGFYIKNNGYNRPKFYGVGDINSDGYDDIAFSNMVIYGKNSNIPKVFIGDYCQENSINCFTLNNPGGLALDFHGDVNGDGFSDVAYLQGDKKLLVVLGNNNLPATTNSSFLLETGRAFTVTTSFAIDRAFSVDFNGDGVDDVAAYGSVKGTYSTQKTDLFLIYGSQSLQREYSYPIANGSVGFNYQIMVPDGFFDNILMYQYYSYNVGNIFGSNYDNIITCNGYIPFNYRTYNSSCIILKGGEDYKLNFTTHDLTDGDGMLLSGYGYMGVWGGYNCLESPKPVYFSKDEVSDLLLAMPLNQPRLYAYSSKLVVYGGESFPEEPFPEASQSPEPSMSPSSTPSQFTSGEESNNIIDELAVSFAVVIGVISHIFHYEI